MIKELSTNSRLAIKLSLDFFACLFAFLLGYFIRFPWADCVREVSHIAPYLMLFLSIRLAIFAAFRLYSTMWRYSAVHSLIALVKATAVGTVAVILTNYLLAANAIPRSVILIDFFAVIFFAGGIRLMVRYYSTYRRDQNSERDSKRRVLIYGAGDAGEQLLRNLLQYKDSGIFVVGFVDDDQLKRGKYIHSKRILGNRDDIAKLISEYSINAIYFCVPSMTGAEARNVFKIVKEQAGDIEVKTIPGLTDLVSGRITINELRRFEISDLLRRRQVHLDPVPVLNLIEGKSVLVVGGGGSIGSELCRQIAAIKPSRLVIVDSSEFNVYKIEEELHKSFPDLSIIGQVADACVAPLMETVFTRFKPQLVFHAAAYKHVPLMEANPWAATYNNLTSTHRLAHLATKFNVERFILISSDKAVNPTNVMGATKRICELICQVEQLKSKTEFITVRFGNVLGSSGSVIPKFAEQIAAGGPITVTHPDITRYFMLISEAVELVLQAGATGEGGQLYVLDMGEPIKIAELAEYMIELSGLRPHKDIKIQFSGLRPGEKMYESLYFEGEEVPTRIPNLFVLKPNLNVNGTYHHDVLTLVDSQFQMDIHELKAGIKKLVPEYQPSNNGD